MMEWKVITDHDKVFVMDMDQQLSELAYANLVYSKSAYILWENEQAIGIITYVILWNKVPFMNLLVIKTPYRGQGYGKQAVIQWEQMMKQQGYAMVLVSTQVNETAQHFYRQLGYVDCGGMVFHDTPFDQPMELFMRKVL